MALFVWKCGLCGHITKKLLPKRPELGYCDRLVTYTKICVEFEEPCHGKLKFVTNTGSQTMEVIDSGLMAKAIERPVNIEEKIAERNALADKEKYEYE